MNRVEKLIAEMCPNGVEFKALKEMAAYSKSRISSLSLDRESYVGVDNLLPEMKGKVSSNYTPSTGTSINYDPGDVLIGNIRPYLKKIWLSDSSGGASQDVLVIRIKEEYLISIVPRFLYYALASHDFFAYNMQHAKGAKMPRGDKKAIMKFRIPLPPLEIQHEIARILDKFTELERELERELEARKRQYQYYRDKLLNFEGGDSGIPLGQLGQFIRGSGIRKSDFTESGTGCIHYGQIHTHYGIWATSTKSFISPNFPSRLRKACSGDLVIATTSEDDEAVAKAVAWLGDENVAISTDAYIFRHSLNAKYVAYFFQTELFQSQKRPHITGTKVRRISGKSLAKIRIPVPPLKVQHKIVTILDKFDALVNDLSIGLPAEIHARRKQYEYYRDRLLTFKETA